MLYAQLRLTQQREQEQQTSWFILFNSRRRLQIEFYEDQPQLKVDIERSSESKAYINETKTDGEGEREREKSCKAQSERKGQDDKPDSFAYPILVLGTQEASEDSFV